MVSMSTSGTQPILAWMSSSNGEALHSIAEDYPSRFRELQNELQKPSMDQPKVRRQNQSLERLKSVQGFQTALLATPSSSWCMGFVDLAGPELRGRLSPGGALLCGLRRFLEAAIPFVYFGPRPPGDLGSEPRTH